MKDLCESKDAYRIPMYQRNYAWDEGEITQLIQDIIDYQLKPERKPYYIGTLVVFHGKNIEAYETIDGQQRLTTLSLLIAFLKNETDVSGITGQKLIIDFESREHSQKTFSAIYHNRV